MTDPKPRRWFQIHLSTVLALTLTVAVLMWLNLRGFSEPAMGYSENFQHAGWPVRVHMNQESDGSVCFDFSNNEEEKRINTWLFSAFGMNVDNIAVISWGYHDKDHLYWWLLPNTLVALLILLPVLLVAETLARKRRAPPLE